MNKGFLKPLLRFARTDLSGIKKLKDLEKLLVKSIMEKWTLRKWENGAWSMEFYWSP
jgi:hypothetical protein